MEQEGLEGFIEGLALGFLSFLDVDCAIAVIIRGLKGG